jgi:deoxyribodipyrimidine photolyase-related protein
MSTFCKECSFDPKQRVGEAACPFTTLYWDFSARHSEWFAGITAWRARCERTSGRATKALCGSRAEQVLALLDQGRL